MSGDSMMVHALEKISVMKSIGQVMGIGRRTGGEGEREERGRREKGPSHVLRCLALLPLFRSTNTMKGGRNTGVRRHIT